MILCDLNDYVSRLALVETHRPERNVANRKREGTTNIWEKSTSRRTIATNVN